MSRVTTINTSPVSWSDPVSRSSSGATRRKPRPVAVPAAQKRPTPGNARMAAGMPWYELYNRLRAVAPHLNTGVFSADLLRDEDKQDLQAYDVFCTTYAPKLWGIILLANLPVTHSEEILLKTFVRAWNQRRQNPFTGDHWLSRLISLAHKEGLPVERVQAILRSQLPQAHYRNDE